MDGVDNIHKAEAVKTRFMSTSRDFIFRLVLWILLDWQWRAEGAQLMNTSELNVNRAQLINASELNVTLPPGVDLTNQAKTVKNYNVPLPVYICVPLLTAAISGCLVYGFCWWKMKLVRRRKMILEKQNMRRRRSSLQPGSSERGKKFGLTRAVGPDGDALTIPTAKVLSLARKLDDVEQLVLDYKSLDMGDRLPEKQEYKVKDVAYNISINPLFNSLQSGACGYVLRGDDNAATSSSGPKKPEEGPDEDSDSDGSPKTRTSKKLPTLDSTKKTSTTSIPRLSRLSTESRSKEDPLRRSLAAKSLIKEAKKEADEEIEEESAEESSDDASSVASSVESLDAERESGATSEEESDDESIKRHDSPRSPTISRLSNMTSAIGSPIRTRLSPEPEAKEELSSAGTRSSNASVSPQASAAPRASKAAVPAEHSPVPSAESEAESDIESSTASPSTKWESTLASLSTKISKRADSGEGTSRTSLNSKYFEAPDEESPKVRLSPRSSKASPSPRASSTPRASKTGHSGDDALSADSGEDSPRSSSAPRASKATVPGEDAPRTSLIPSASKVGDSEKELNPSSPESSDRKSTKGPVSPRFANVTASDKDQKKGSIKKPNWDPSTVPERSSIKRSVSKSQGASPEEPSSPKVSDSPRKAPRRTSYPGSPKERRVSESSSEPGSPNKPSVKQASGSSPETCKFQKT